MDDEQVNTTIAELERRLLDDDLGLGRRLRRIGRADNARVVAVVAALTAATILLAAGLALASGVLWFAGVAAFLAAFAADRHREPTADCCTVEGRCVDQWNEVLPIAGAWSTVVGELRVADGLDPWCPTLRPIPNTGTHDTAVFVGRHRPVKLRITGARTRSMLWRGRPTPSMSSDVEPGTPPLVDGRRTYRRVEPSRRLDRPVRSSAPATRSGRTHRT